MALRVAVATQDEFSFDSKDAQELLSRVSKLFRERDVPVELDSECDFGLTAQGVIVVAASAGLDAGVRTQSQLTRAFDVDADVILVTALDFCDGRTPNPLGCKVQKPGSGEGNAASGKGQWRILINQGALISMAGTPNYAGLDAVVWGHEYGHAMRLPHRCENSRGEAAPQLCGGKNGEDGALMNLLLFPGNRGITRDECAYLLVGTAANSGATPAGWAVERQQAVQKQGGIAKAREEESALKEVKAAGQGAGQRN